MSTMRMLLPLAGVFDLKALKVTGTIADALADSAASKSPISAHRGYQISVLKSSWWAFGSVVGRSVHSAEHRQHRHLDTQVQGHLPEPGVSG